MKYRYAEMIWDETKAAELRAIFGGHSYGDEEEK